MYHPLALASLEDVILAFRVNLAASITLLIDYLQGLVYLHNSKGIMHRDIKPSNLGVLSFSPPRGIILDLDAATTEEASDDHGKGTVRYLAPEIINLKLVFGSDSDRYGTPVDVFALGMSAFHALLGGPVDWDSFDDPSTMGVTLPETETTNFVLERRLQKFHDHLEARVINLRKPLVPYLEYFRLLKQMTSYLPIDRYSASEALGAAEGLAGRQGEAKFIPRPGTQGTKRKIGES